MELKQNILTSYEGHSHVLHFLRVKFNSNGKIASEICRLLKISASIKLNIWSHFYWFIRINSNIDKLFTVFFFSFSIFIQISKNEKKCDSNFLSIIFKCCFTCSENYGFDWRFFFCETKVKVKNHVYLRLISIWAVFLEHHFFCARVCESV